MEFQRQGQKFSSHGVQVTRPVDLLAEEKFAILRNVRAYIDGTVHPRLGLASPTAAMGVGPVHSIKRYFDAGSLTTAELAGSDTALYFNAASISTGFSGNPLSFVPVRPYSSEETYMCVADSSKMVKVSKAGTAYNWGIAPPNVPLSAAIGGPSYTTIESFETLPNGWTAGGTAGAIALVAAKRVNTTITYILYDTGSTGWACVSPAALDDSIQEGALITVKATEEFRVGKVFPAINTTTISSIKYDSGTSGLCTIQLTSTSLEGLERDAFVRLAAAENVRVLSVTTGPDGIPSFRCSTTATRSAGNAVTGLNSFRAYFSGTFAAADTLTDEAFESSITMGIGWFNKVANYNLATVNNRPLQPNDEIHLSLRLDQPKNLTEGKIFFNVDATTNFDRNYFYYPFTASALTPAAKDTLTTQSVQQNIIQRRQIDDNFGSGEQIFTNQRILQEDWSLVNQTNNDTSQLSSDTIDITKSQTSSGDNQWSELVFKVSDLIQIGPDQSKTLANISALRIQFSVTDTTVCDVDALWIGGTYGLNSTTFPYVWTYCYKASATGVTSNPAPPLRTGLLINRGRAVLTPTVSSDAQVDLIEYFRYGGTLPEWHHVGTTANSGTFTDSFPDEDISGNAGLDEDNFQPFPIADNPKSGVCNVVGTEVTWVSGDTFSTSWARGSQVIINSVPTSLYASPSSTTVLSLEDNIGTLTNVAFILPSPTLKGQAMTSIWGPYVVGGVTYVFACKRGTLYFTKGNNPDSAPEDHLLEITSPQEPLLGGCVYDGQSYVFSTERMFRIIPTLQVGDLFEAQEVPVGKGLMTPWAIAVDEQIYFLSRDGLYVTNGQQVTNLSDADLYPLFPHDGQIGTATGDYLAPDFTQLVSLRLAAGDGLVKFTSKDTGGTYRTWVYDTRAKGFPSLDTYNPPVACHYWDEGGSSFGSTPTRERVGTSNGLVYTANSGTTDAGNTITSQVRTRSWDFGETRSQKLFGDIMVDHVGTVTITPGFNSYSATIAGQVKTQATRGQSIVDLVSGGGYKARNVALDFSFTDPTVVLYEWQPSFVPRPEDTKLRWMDYTDGGTPKNKWLQGMVLTADTNGLDRTVQVQGDNGIVIATLTVNHNGYSTKAYPGAGVGDVWTPQPTHLMRLVPSDANSWEIFNVEWRYELTPESSTRWQIEGTSHGLEDFHHLRRLWIGIQSTAIVTLSLDGDGTTVVYTLPSTGGVYKKLLVPLQAKKAKLWKYTLTSEAAFRVFYDDTEVEVLGWGMDGFYKDVKPLGGMRSNSYQSTSQAQI